ncbi:MAG: cold shock domain-containing protein [Saprospiraceae bacterium]|nr:cold shock domain-containing protein [Saprospiraceae bacterium]
MAKSKETYGKKENEKKKQKKRQDKAERKEQRKSDTGNVKSFEEMIMYVDENGNLTPEKPDPSKRIKINKEDIVLGVPNRPQFDPQRKGRVTYFDDAKGYGFITDRDNDERIFVHASELEEMVQVNDKVTFEKGRGPKGPIAINVQKIKL